MPCKKTIAAFALTLLGLGAPYLPAAEKAILQAPVSSSETVSFDVYLPLQHRTQLQALLSDLHNPTSPGYHRWLTPQQFLARFGTSAAQVAAIQQQLSSYGLESTLLSPHRIHVTGTASAVDQAFGTILRHGSYRNGKATIVATQGLSKPSALAQANAVVVGLSGFIRMRQHSRPVALPQNRNSPTGSYWFDDLKQAYSFPSYKKLTGSGVTIGILMSGAYNPSDMAMYFGHEKLATPSYSTVNIDGGAPYDATNSLETHLDLQQTGGMAPQANIILYNIPDLSDDHVMDGLAQIVNDNKADVVSMSFGGPEIFYTAGDNDSVDYTSILQEENDLLAQGTAQGITFVASSGDSGALSAPPVDCFNDVPNCGMVRASAEFPASSPNVTGVGGTNLTTTFTGLSSDLNSIYLGEEAYADPLTEDIFYGTSATGSVWGSGGGDSMVFQKPDYQRLVQTGNAQYRTVPDLALHMGGCPAAGTTNCSPDDSSDVAAIGGQLVGVIGTSASAPDFAGLTALAIQSTHQRLGNENYLIYTLAATQSAGLPINVFKTGIPGDNGLYSTTKKGYNRVLGNGTLNGVNFLLAPFMQTAGTPQTSTNP